MANNKEFKIKNGLIVDSGDVRLPSNGKVYLWTGHNSNFLQYNLWQASASGGMFVKNIASGGDIYFQPHSITALTLSGTDQNATFGGNLIVPHKIMHSGDTDNYHAFGTDTQSFVTGNSTRMSIANSLVRFNQEGVNQDFQIFGENVDNLFYVDASADKIGIGTASPAEKLEVVGNIKTTGDVIADTHFTSTDSNATLSSSGSGGNVYLRPNGKGTATGETRIDTNGLLKVNSISTSHGLEIAQSTNTGYAPASILLKATQSTARGGGIYSYNTQTDNGWYSGSLYNNTNLWAVTFLNGTSFNPAIAQTNYAILSVDGPNSRVGIGTSSPASKLHIESGNAHNKLSITSTANGGTGYDASIDLLGSAANSEVAINMGINGDADREQIKTYQSDMSFRTNNTERMRIDSSGKVRIGATLGLNHLLNIQTASTSGLAQIEFRNTQAGSQIGMPANTNALSFFTADAERIRITSAGDVSVSSGGGLYFGGSNRSTSTNAQAYIKESGLNLDIKGNDNVRLLGDGGNIILHADYTGKVGIGTTSPGYKLDLGGTTGNTANTLRLHQNNGGTALRIGAGSGSSDVVLWRIDGDSSGSPANHAGATNLGAYGYSLKYFGTGSGQENRLKLLADNLGASSQNVVYNVGQNGDINFEQKVGIGTNSPSARLHIDQSGNTRNDGLFIERNGSTYGLNLYVNSGGYGVIGGNGGFTPDIMKLDFNLQYVGIGVEPKAKLHVEELGIDTTTTTTSATSLVTLASLNKTHFRSARFTIQITNTTDGTYHTTEILAIHDGTTANITEFGEVHTGSSVEATFDADISSGNFRLLATPTSTNNMVFKVVSYAITV